MPNHLSRAGAENWRDRDDAADIWLSASGFDGLNLYMRAVAPAVSDGPFARRPVLFVHGATFASRLYDIPAKGASWLKACAAAGFPSYALDLRGYGKSRSPATDMLEAQSDRPYAAGRDVIADIDDAVTWLLEHHACAAVDLVGGSWGSITCALYAGALGRRKVRSLTLFAPIYAEHNAGWKKIIADPADPARANPALGAVRLVTEQQTRARWDEEIPPGGDWREERVFQALIQSTFDDDPRSLDHRIPAFRAPNGTLLDLWEAFNARPVYDPAAITCPTLLVRGGADQTSTRSDALTLFDRVGATEKRYVEIANGAHFLMAERQAPQVFDTLNGFLKTV